MFSDMLSNTNSSFLQPSTVIDQIHIGVIATVSVLVSLIFFLVYFQLILVVWYGYKLLSYQTVFLFNISLWSSLRLTLYSFYFFHCCQLVNNLQPAAEWILVSFPSILVFIALGLIVYYFMEHLLKVMDRRQELCNSSNWLHKTMNYLRYLLTATWIVSLVLFITIDVVLGIFINIYMTPSSQTNPAYIDSEVSVILRISRVVLLESLILLMGLALGTFILIIYATELGKNIMESKDVSRKQARFISFILILLFSSRAVYNITTAVAQSSHFYPLGYSKTFTTDMADFDGHSKEENIVYFSVLFLWEVVPIFFLVYFFRFKRPRSLQISTFNHNYPTNSLKSHSSYTNGTSSSRIKSSQMSIPKKHCCISEYSGYSSRGYGSISNKLNCSTKYSLNGNSQLVMPGTTPPQLFTSSPSVFSENRLQNL